MMIVSIGGAMPLRMRFTINAPESIGLRIKAAAEADAGTPENASRAYCRGSEHGFDVGHGWAIV